MSTPSTPLIPSTEAYLKQSGIEKTDVYFRHPGFSDFVDGKLVLPHIKPQKVNMIPFYLPQNADVPEMVYTCPLGECVIVVFQDGTYHDHELKQGGSVTVPAGAWRAITWLAVCNIKDAPHFPTKSTTWVHAEVLIHMNKHLEKVEAPVAV